MKKVFLAMILTGLFSACVNTDIDSETPPWDRTDIKEAASQDLTATVDGSLLPPWKKTDAHLLTEKPIETSRS